MGVHIKAYTAFGSQQANVQSGQEGEIHIDALATLDSQIKIDEGTGQEER